MEKEEKQCGKCQEYLESWKKERADFINYKKAEAERMENMAKYASEDLVYKILPILDHFEIAENHLTDEQKKDSHIIGLLHIKRQLEDMLKNSGVEEIEVKEGDKFDPNIHEADAVAEGKDSGIILDILKKGYTLNGRLLRPAKVKVSK